MECGTLAGEGDIQLGELAPEPPHGKMRQHLGIPLACNQGGSQAAATDAKAIGHHTGYLDVGILQHLRHPVLGLGAGLDQLTSLRVSSRNAWIGGGG